MAYFVKQLERWHPVVFLLIFFTLALQTAVSKFFTMDEPVHIIRGAALWQTGDTRLQYEHTPLAHWAIGALLPLADNLPAIAQLPDWQTVQHIPLTEQFLWLADPPLNLALVTLLARLPVIFAGLLLGAALAAWSKQMALPGQMAVLILYAFSPNLLAHFSLATTDGVLTAVFTLSLFALWRFWQRPSLGRWLLAAGLLGLALVAKLTALLLLPLGLILSYASAYENKPQSAWRTRRKKIAGLKPLSWWQPGLIWLAMLPAAGLVVWALYSFDLRPLPWLNLPLPAAAYFNSLRDLLLHTGAGHVSFMQGQRSVVGWWNYFLVAFSVKTPAVTLALLGVALALLTRQRRWRQTIYWWLPPLALFVTASLGGLNIGYRHILAVLPFAWLLVGTTAVTWQQKRWSQVVWWGLLAWYALASLRQAPHYLAYFNEFVGGSAQGVTQLSDSNLDWGQDLPLLAAYLAQNPAAQFSYFGPGDPAWAGITRPPLTGSPDFHPANPAPGRYALSASHIQGIQLADWDLFDNFRRREPTGSLGYSILLYEIQSTHEGGWVAHCLDPGPILTETAVTHILGISNYRSVFFDCATSWVFPDGGAPGWYILPQRSEWPPAAWLPENLSLVYNHDAAGDEPSYAVYYWDGETAPFANLFPPGQTAQLAGGDSLPLPVSVGETATLAGYRLERFDWWTGWRVVEETAVPLTLAGHLYAGGPPLVADGLGFTSEQWRAGDLFLQRFAYSQSGDFLETGLYDFMTGERLGVENGRDAGALLRLLPK